MLALVIDDEPHILELVKFNLEKFHFEVVTAADGLQGMNLARRRKPDLVFSLIYVDLDHFKSCNDHYGFKSGDRMLLLVKRLLTWAVSRHGQPSDFVGHHLSRKGGTALPGGGPLLQPDGEGTLQRGRPVAGRGLRPGP